jgi:FMN phosphatase YigB (HAD superfamily)
MVDLVGQLKNFEQERGRPKALLVDFFDTVVGRTVEPEYVKAIWAKRMRYHVGLGMPADDLHRIRVSIESELCSRSLAEGYDDDFRYFEMARLVYRAVSRRELIPQWCTETEFCALAEKVELTVEKQTQFLHSPTVELLTYAAKFSIPVYLVSDTFLTARHIRELLCWWKLEGYFTDLFLSSDYLLAKRTGRLYEHILKALQVQGSDLLMFGDNLYSDVANARSHNIEAIQVSHPSEQQVEKVGFEVAPARMQAAFCRAEDQRTPFAELSSTLLYTIAELFSQVRRDGVQDLLFCSREGLLLKELFDRYQKAVCGEPCIRTHYFYTSRVASFLPSLGLLRQEHFERLFRQYKDISLAMFLKSLQFSEDEITDVGDQLRIDVDAVISNFSGSLTYQQLRGNSLFRQYYAAKRGEQKVLAAEYLGSFYPQTKLPKTVALVDVGWRGTIQDNIRALLDPHHTLQGYYVGLIAPAEQSASNKKLGVLFSSYPSESPFFGAFAETRALFEIVLSATHPATVSYERIGKQVVPVFGSDEKEPSLRALVSELQESIADRFQALLDVCVTCHLDETADIQRIARLHARVGLSPNKQELHLIARIQHFENFGLFDTTSFALPERIGGWQALRNLVRYWRNPSTVLGSTIWPALSLHREGLPRLLPRYAKRRTREIFGV